MALHKSGPCLHFWPHLILLSHLMLISGFSFIFPSLRLPPGLHHGGSFPFYIMSSHLILFQLCTYPLLFFTWLAGFIFFMALINIQNHLIYFYLSFILEYKLYDSKDLVFLLLSSQCLRSNIYSMNRNQTQYIDYGNAKKSPSKFIILKDQKRLSLDYLYHKL